MKRAKRSTSRETTPKATIDRSPSPSLPQQTGSLGSGSSGSSGAVSTTVVEDVDVNVDRDRDRAASFNLQSKYLVISDISELPQNIKDKLPEFELSMDILSHRLGCLLHVLSFCEKQPWITPTELARVQRQRQERSEYLASRPNSGEQVVVHGVSIYLSPMIRPLDSLLNPESPKKYFKFIKREGHGGYGSVYFAKNKRNGDLVAIKRVQIKNEASELACRREISFLKFCNHPTIVKFYDAFRVDNEIWIAMPYVEGYDIDRACKQFEFNEEHIAFVAKQLCRGLRFLHHNSLIHRDLKGANVMLTIYGEVIIVDLGLMLDYSNEDLLHRCGTRFWMAPEVIRQEPQGPGVDIWSMAICLVEMANGRPPSWQSSYKQMLRVSMSGLGPSVGLEDVTLWSDGFKDFLDQCLAFDPSQRPSAEQLLNHKWIETMVNDDRSQDSIARVVQVCEVQGSINIDSMF